MRHCGVRRGIARFIAGGKMCSSSARQESARSSDPTVAIPAELPRHLSRGAQAAGGTRGGDARRHTQGLHRGARGRPVPRQYSSVVRSPTQTPNPKQEMLRLSMTCPTWASLAARSMVRRVGSATLENRSFFSIGTRGSASFPVSADRARFRFEWLCRRKRDFEWNTYQMKSVDPNQAYRRLRPDQRRRSRRVTDAFGDLASRTRRPHLRPARTVAAPGKLT